MPETPKKKGEMEQEKTDSQDKASWSEDQKKREYYYDDAHGYEVYEPEEDENEED
jgi:hypothetical protein